MDLPDCPPGAEGYEDTVTELAKKPEPVESTCTKVNIFFFIIVIFNKCIK